MVVIIGGGKGIGKALVDSYASDDHVIFTYHQTKPTKILKRKVMAFNLDLCSTSSVSKFVDQFETASISTLIYVASTFFLIPFGQKGQPSRVKEKLWKEIFDINLSAAYFLCEEIEQKLADGANVQFFGDVQLSKYSAELFPYAASKAGLSLFVKSLARAWAPRIRVNEIRLGYATPPRNFSTGKQKKWMKEKAAQVPMGRLCGFESIVRTSKFLTNENYLTGASIHLDGGLSIVE